MKKATPFLSKERIYLKEGRNCRYSQNIDFAIIVEKTNDATV
jgi:hypothetical protein